LMGESLTKPWRGRGGATGAAAGEATGTRSSSVAVGAVLTASLLPLPKGEVESAEPTG
jgi:hypothetical protein